jgi:hypothetical protein
MVSHGIDRRKEDVIGWRAAFEAMPLVRLDT